MTRRRAGSPRQSLDDLTRNDGDMYTFDEVQRVVDRHCEAAALEAAKWKRIAQGRLQQIGRLLNKDFTDDEAFPYGTLDDALAFRLTLVREIEWIKARISIGGTTDGELKFLAGRVADKSREARMVSDWIDAERLRILFLDLTTEARDERDHAIRPQ